MAAITTSDEAVERSRTERSASAPSDQAAPSARVGHDEFDPTGTLALTLFYFGLLVLLWSFTYFVEFLGNDLVVVG